MLSSTSHPIAYIIKDTYVYVYIYVLHVNHVFFFVTEVPKVMCHQIFYRQRLIFANNFKFYSFRNLALFSCPPPPFFVWFLNRSSARFFRTMLRSSRLYCRSRVLERLAMSRKTGSCLGWQEECNRHSISACISVGRCSSDDCC